MAKKTSSKVVVVGAGCAGLAAGIALLRHGFDVTLIEKSDRVGGLAGGIEFNGNIYEYGPHIFHTTDPEVLADVKEIAGHLIIPFKKTIKIKFLGKYFDFPLTISDIILKLPPLTLFRAIISFLYYFIAGIIQGEKHLTNSERVLQRYYGNVLYKIFFKDYITKVWGIGPDELDPSFAKRRIPRIDIFKVLTDLRQKIWGPKKENVATDDYVEKHEGESYTTKKGFSLITEAYADYFQKQGGTLLCNSDLKRIDMERRKCVFKTKEEDTLCEVELDFDYVVSTIPLCNLPRMINPKPNEKMLAAASEIEYRGCVFIGIHIRKPKVLPVSFMYFRDKSFNRISDLGNLCLEIEPKDSTILVAEITCQPDDEYWKDDKKTAETVIDELCHEGLIEREDVIEYHLFRSAYAYPLYKVGYKENVNTVLEGLKSQGKIFSIGRQGQFEYVNTHIAFKMGYQAAHEIASLEKV